MLCKAFKIYIWKEFIDRNLFEIHVRPRFSAIINFFIL